MTTYIEGVQHSGNILAAERRIDISERLAWLQKELYPLVHLSAGGLEGQSTLPKPAGLPARKEAVTAPEYKVIEKAPFGRWTAINYSTGYTAGATTFICDAVEHIRIGHVLKLVGGENVRVTGKSNGSHTIDVARACGGTAAGNVADNTPVLVIGLASEEHSATGTKLGVQNAARTNYTQIFRNPTGLSGTLANSSLYTGKKRPELRQEAWIETAKLIEAAFLHGEPKEDLTGGPTGNPIRYTGGIIYWGTTGGGVVVTATTTFTKANWLTFTRQCFTYKSSVKILLCAPYIIEMLDFWKDSKLEMRPNDLTYGIRVAQWETGQGTLLIVRDTLLENSPAGSLAGFGKMAIAFDPAQIGYRYLQNRDIGLFQDIVKDGHDGWTDEIMGEIGFYIENPEAVSILNLDDEVYA